MNRLEIEQLPAKLLVEGNDELHVVSAICQRFAVPETFGIIDCKGISNLLAQITVRIKNRETPLGILIDADTELNSRWQQLGDILTKLGYDLPATPDPTGSIVTSDKFSTVVGIWIMPNNQVPGMLEDFARILIPAMDAALPYASKIITEIQQASVARFAAIHQSKAIIHTWLAWQEDPGTPMGLAITKSYLDHNHALCVLFVDWLNRLFNSNSEVS